VNAAAAPPPRPTIDRLPPGDADLPSEPLAAVDLAWLRMDEPANLMVINGVLILDGRVDLERLRQVVRDRLLTIPRFRERIVRHRSGRPAWQVDPGFELDRHVVLESIAGDDHEAELSRRIGRWMGEPLPPDRPLWRFTLIDGYRGGSAMVARLHHVIGDGIALMLVLLSLTDLAAEAPAAGAVPDNPFAALFAHAQADLAAVRAATEQVMPEGMKLLLHPAQALRSAGHLLTVAASAGALGRLVLRRRDPQTLFKGALGIEKRVAWSHPLPLADLRQIAAAVGGNVNDVLHAAAVGGLRRYLLRHGEAPERLGFRAAVPVNLRPLDEMAELGNRFGLVFLSLPVGIADPRRRLLELRRRVRALKRSAEPLVTFSILRLLGRVPRPLQRLVVRLLATKTTAVLTSVPGPQRPLHLAGRRMRDLVFWVPQAGRVGLGLSIGSYDGHARIGVATDAGLVPDPETVVAEIHREIDALREIAAGAPRAGI
jgi:WS/DGAT/MGAT family acyltransferase